eukprot:6172734-Amphidinium_carterae.3
MECSAWHSHMSASFFNRKQFQPSLHSQSYVANSCRDTDGLKQCLRSIMSRSEICWHHQRPRETRGSVMLSGLCTCNCWLSDRVDRLLMLCYIERWSMSSHVDSHHEAWYLRRRTVHAHPRHGVRIEGLSTSVIQSPEETPVAWCFAA